MVVEVCPPSYAPPIGNSSNLSQLMANPENSPKMWKISPSISRDWLAFVQYSKISSAKSVIISSSPPPPGQPVHLLYPLRQDLYSQCKHHVQEQASLPRTPVYVEFPQCVAINPYTCLRVVVEESNL